MTQYKSTQHTENQENLKQSADIKNKMTQVLGLSAKDFNTATKKMLQQVISTLETERCHVSTKTVRKSKNKNFKMKHKMEEKHRRTESTLV